MTNALLNHRCRTLIELQQARGKPANDDFLSGSRFLSVVPLVTWDQA